MLIALNTSKALSTNWSLLINNLIKIIASWFIVADYCSNPGRRCSNFFTNWYTTWNFIRCTPNYLCKISNFRAILRLIKTIQIDRIIIGYLIKPFLNCNANVEFFKSNFFYINFLEKVLSSELPIRSCIVTSGTCPHPFKWYRFKRDVIWHNFHIWRSWICSSWPRCYLLTKFIMFLNNSQSKINYK